MKNTLRYLTFNFSNHKKIVKSEILLLLISILLITYGCDNPSTFDFKTDRVDQTYQYSFIDTGTVWLKTIKEDSLRGDEFTKDLIGCYRDATFGFVKASVSAEILLPKTIVSLGTLPVLDSVVLTLKYSGKTKYFGWLSDKVKWNVYELNQRIYFDSSYYTTTKFRIKKDSLLGTYNGRPSPDNTRMIRIKLRNEFGEKIIKASKDQLEEDKLFTKYINGISIIPEDMGNTGSIIYFDLKDDSSNVVLYYHNTKDTSTIVLQINEKSARINHFEHDFSGSEAAKQLSNPEKNYNSVYLQPMSGLKARVDLPYLKNIVKNGLVAVNRAELVITPDESLGYIENKPPALLLLKTDKNNKNYALKDRAEDYYGGKWNAGKGEYSVLITRHIQDLLVKYYNDENFSDSFSLNLIIPSDNPIIADPLVIKNMDLNGNSKVKFRISYTKLN